MALGDSYSSGEGAPDPATGFVWNGRNTDVPGVNMCHRSASAYGPRVARNLNLPSPGQFHFVACSGAVSNYLVTRNADNSLEPPQYNAFFEPAATTDLVTISIGGNDVGFATIIEYCLMVVDCSTDASFAPGIERMVRTSTPIWKSIYDQIQARTSLTTRVLVLTYPQILGTGPGCAGTGWAALSVAERQWMRFLWSTMNLRIKAAARQSGIEVVDTERSFQGQLVCDALPYAHGLNAEASTDPLANVAFSFHPNGLGHGRMANLVLDVIEGVAPGAPVAGTPLAADEPDPPPESIAATLSTGRIGLVAGTSGFTVTDPNRTVTLRASGYAPGAAVALSYTPIPTSATDPEPGAVAWAQATADAGGAVHMTVHVAELPDQVLMVAARGMNTEGGQNLLTTTLWLPSGAAAATTSTTSGTDASRVTTTVPLATTATATLPTTGGSPAVLGLPALLLVVAGGAVALEGRRRRLVATSRRNRPR